MAEDITRLLEKCMTRYITRAHSLIKEWPEYEPGTFIELNQNNGSLFNSPVPLEASVVPGLMWLTYAYSGESVIKEKAIEAAWRFTPLSKVPMVDAGITVYRAAAWGYHLTREERLKVIALESAETFTRLWDDRNGVFLIFDPEMNVEEFLGNIKLNRDRSKSKRRADLIMHKRETIIDISYCFDILWWAGQYDRKYTDMCITHLENLLKFGFVRENGSTFQALSFHPETGEPEELHNHQGYSNNTTWSRGQSWAMLSHAMAYQATGKKLFLDTFVRLADYWATMIPDDYVPFYDMSDPRIPHIPRDSCSAAIAANSLIRVCQTDSSLEGKYRPLVDATLTELINHYQTPGGLVLHGSWGGAFDPPVETIMQYGNHYLLEAAYMSLRARDYLQLRGY